MSFLRSLAAQHGLSPTRTFALLRIDWDDFDALPPDGVVAAEDLANRAASLQVSLQLNGANAWAKRVCTSSGDEALFDRDLRFLAISQSGRTIRTGDGKTVVLRTEDYLGIPFVNFLPSLRPSPHAQKDGLMALDWDGLFTGRRLGIQVDTHLAFRFDYWHCVFEFWAINTTDQGVLIHSILHRDAKVARLFSGPGLLIQHIRAF